MKINIDEILLRQNVPVSRIKDAAIRISEALEDMNLIAESDALNKMVTTIDDSIYGEIINLQKHLSTDGTYDYLISYALLKRVGLKEDRIIEKVIVRVDW